MANGPQQNPPRAACGYCARLEAEITFLREQLQHSREAERDLRQILARASAHPRSEPTLSTSEPDSEGQWLTTVQASLYCDVSERTVRRWIAAGIVTSKTETAHGHPVRLVRRDTLPAHRDIGAGGGKAKALGSEGFREEGGAWVSITEAAQALGCAPKTVRQRIKRGEIAAGLVDGPHGPEYRIPASALPTISAVWTQQSSKAATA